jgi:hypothetical protein
MTLGLGPGATKQHTAASALPCRWASLPPVYVKAGGERAQRPVARLALELALIPAGRKKNHKQRQRLHAARRRLYTLQTWTLRVRTARPGKGSAGLATL